MPKATITVTLRVPPALYDAVARRAKEQGSSMNALLLRLIEASLKEKVRKE